VANDTILVASTADTGRHVVTVHRVRFAGLHSLAWSPDGRLIAYVNGNGSWRRSANVGVSSIWVVNASGGEPQAVTSGDALNVSPAWLDARHLLFVSNRGGERAVYVVGVGPHGSRGEPRIVPGLSEPHSIAFSTGTRRLAYAKLVLRLNIRSYPLGRPAPVSIRDGRPVTAGTQIIELCDVSPDGRWIVYDGTLRGHKDVYRMPLTGGQSTPLTGGAVGGEAPRWSPDGRYIAFHSISPAAGWASQIDVLPAEGGAPATLTSDSGHNAFPTWSPDGRRLAFHSMRTGRAEIWVLSREAAGGPWGNATQLTDFGCGNPDWASDGTRLVCEVEPSDVDLISPDRGQVLRRNLLAAHGLRRLPLGLERFSRDGRTVYTAATDSAGRQGIWAVPVANGPARLVIAYDDPALTSPGGVGVGRDRLFLPVSEYESDIWVATLKY
jgi:Tol biopolymer transport system component